MEFVLLFVIVLQFAYIIYKDVLYAKQAERLQLKLMSKDVSEYVGAVEPPAEAGKSVEDPYIPIEEATVEQILNG